MHIAISSQEIGNMEQNQLQYLACVSYHLHVLFLVVGQRFNLCLDDLLCRSLQALLPSS